MLIMYNASSPAFTHSTCMAPDMMVMFFLVH